MRGNLLAEGGKIKTAV